MTGRVSWLGGLGPVVRWGFVGCDSSCGWGVGCPESRFAARLFLRMEVRLGREADKLGGGTGDVACDVYPPRLVTVVRDRCSAGGGGGLVCLVGRSSGCGWAGSLGLCWSFDEVAVISLWVSVVGWSLELKGPLCARYQSRIVAALLLAAREVRLGVRCGVDLSS